MSPNLRSLFESSPLVPPRVLGEQGTCADVSSGEGSVDPNIWTPDEELPEETRIENVREAIKHCRGCVVQSECLRYALSVPDIRGVYGGYAFNIRVGRKAAGLVYAHMGGAKK